MKDEVRPGGVEAESVTEPSKPLTLVSVIEELFDRPSGIVRETGLTKMAKLATLIVKVNVWDCEPLLPVTATMKVPAVEGGAKTVSVDIADVPADRVTLGWLNDKNSPPGGTAVRATLPEKPLRLVTVMFDELDEPA